MKKRFVQTYLIAIAACFWLSVETTGHASLDNFATSAVLAAILSPIGLLPWLLAALAFAPRRRGSGLDRVLFRYPTGDPYLLRHLLTSICIFGIIGAGKSSSSGLFFARIVVRINSSGLILASNPDDAQWWRKRFQEAGRPGDLIVFSRQSKARWNILAKLQEGGADARELTDFLVVAAETLIESKGKEELFWKQLSERLLYNIISALMMAGHGVSAGAIANFLGSAPYTGEQLQTEAFEGGFCSQVLQKARANAVDPVRMGDYAMLHNYWFDTFPFMDNKPRSSAQSSVENITHPLSVGFARELFSTTTNASTDDLKAGKWLLLDFPVSAGGPTSKLIYACAKLAVQKEVLRNAWTPAQPVTVIWADEASHVINSGDRDALKEFRKHGGVLVFLSQTILDYFVALGDDGKAKAEGLLGLFGTRVFHAADVATARYAVELVGEAEQEEEGGSFTPAAELSDRLNGAPQWTSTFNRRRLPLMTGRQLTAGLRMGGKSKIVDAWVYRPELYSDGTNIQLMQFHQD